MFYVSFFTYISYITNIHEMFLKYFCSGLQNHLVFISHTLLWRENIYFIYFAKCNQFWSVYVEIHTCFLKFNKIKILGIFLSFMVWVTCEICFFKNNWIHFLSWLIWLIRFRPLQKVEITPRYKYRSFFHEIPLKIMWKICIFLFWGSLESPLGGYQPKTLI